MKFTQVVVVVLALVSTAIADSSSTEAPEDPKLTYAIKPRFLPGVEVPMLLLAVAVPLSVVLGLVLCRDKPSCLLGLISKEREPLLPLTSKCATVELPAPAVSYRTVEQAV